MECMMNHATEGQLQASLDGEARSEDLAGVREHLRLCGQCAAELAALRSLNEEAANALALLDVPAPAVQPALARVRQARAAGSGRFASSRRALARAAMLVLAAAGVASAAIPGSPVRRWLATAVERMAGVLAPAERPAAEAPVPVPVTGSQAGASAAPAQGRVRVLLMDPGEGALVRVLLTDGPRAVVRADESSGARFSSGAGRVEARGVERGEVVVELPRGALTATVEIDGVVVVSREGDSLVARNVRLIEARPDALLFRIGG
jgi:hypothetical protein